MTPAMPTKTAAERSGGLWLLLSVLVEREEDVRVKCAVALGLVHVDAHLR
jgi:hypothetical protein